MSAHENGPICISQLFMHVPTAVLAISLFLLSSCGTIMHGGTQKIGISSTPIGADVTVDGKPEGKTPVIVKMDRNSNHTILVAKKGYQPASATLTNSISGWVWGNILFGSLLGLAVDAISGGLYTLDPENVNLSLHQ
ncbi:PEGA domain-containing protein [uncultured Akkermansia sp.]|uniref:PEGA domain-containing protein n=2 Tax=Akkermansia TaxID=239934 RepID=UPI0025D66773|nr:PEGA domain-containing protein [uncultured Akkermansia sp.]